MCSLRTDKTCCWPDQAGGHEINGGILQQDKQLGNLGFCLYVERTGICTTRGRLRLYMFSQYPTLNQSTFLLELCCYYCKYDLSNLIPLNEKNTWVLESI